MAKIIAPNQEFNGKRAGVAFVDGKGETEDESAIRYFAKHGYDVQGASTSSPEPESPRESAPTIQDEATDVLAGLTLDELRAYAAEQDIDLGGATKKDDVKAVIAEHAPLADSAQD